MRIATEEVSFRSGEETLFGRICLPPDSESDTLRPAVVLVHGLGSGQKSMAGAARDLARRGVVALTFDQRGHGKSGGAYTGDSSGDVRAAARFIAEREGVDASRIGIVGHSSGARDAILACANWDGYAALVCSSTAGIIPREEPGAAEGFYRRTLGSRSPARPGEPPDLRVYPRDGALPWIDGLAMRAVDRVWSLLRGYRLRVRWSETLQTWGTAQAGIAILDVPERPALFIHCGGDKSVPVMASEILYQKFTGPKELIIVPRGRHAAPIARASIRSLWVNWLVHALTSNTETNDSLD
ncbi:MAG: lysophospholipase [Dehalococcoidia bacterium]|nr:lysophospholipase [Dehalococcoidia bacterium]